MHTDISSKLINYALEKKQQKREYELHSISNIVDCVIIL